MQKKSKALCIFIICSCGYSFAMHRYKFFEATGTPTTTYGLRNHRNKWGEGRLPKSQEEQEAGCPNKELTVMTELEPFYSCLDKSN